MAVRKMACQSLTPKLALRLLDNADSGASLLPTERLPFTKYVATL